MTSPRRRKVRLLLKSRNARDHGRFVDGARRDRTDDLLLAKSQRGRSSEDPMPVSPVNTGVGSDLRVG
jgi:hypothetical protein